jgi:hypothetical protein
MPFQSFCVAPKGPNPWTKAVLEDGITNCYCPAMNLCVITPFWTVKIVSVMIEASITDRVAVVA